MTKRTHSNNHRMPVNNHSGIRRVIPLNIGTVVFGILFLYLIVSAVSYATTRHVKSYRVTSGPLAQNQTYTGLALYQEQVVNADTAGFINYYAAENEKVKSGGIVYGISPSKTDRAPVTVSANTLDTIRRSMEDFSTGFNPADFHEVYSLRYSVEGAILDQNLGDKANQSGTLTVGGETISTAGADGIVLYRTDGYENFDLETLKADSVDEKNYHVKSLKTDQTVQAGESIYKLIQSENWSLIIPLTPRQIVNLSDTSSIKVKFLKDGVTQNAAFSILTAGDGSYFGKLDFSNGLRRYIDNRFVDIELVTNTRVGLKVPVSSIVSKEFYTIPEEFATNGGDGNEAGFLRAAAGADGSVQPSFVSTTLYEHKNGKYYIDDTDLKPGDVLVKDGGGSDRYLLNQKESLEGVYSMNKGYAEFRKVNIIDKNEDYCIVEKGTPYGIAQFDNIVLNASGVRESQITAQPS